MEMKFYHTALDINVLAVPLNSYRAGNELPVGQPKLSKCTQFQWASCLVSPLDCVVLSMGSSVLAERGTKRKERVFCNCLYFF